MVLLSHADWPPCRFRFLKRFCLWQLPTPKPNSLHVKADTEVILFNGDVGTTPAIRKVRGQIWLKVTNSLYNEVNSYRIIQTALFPADLQISFCQWRHNRTTSQWRVFVLQALMFSSTQVSNDSGSLETAVWQQQIRYHFTLWCFTHIYI